MFADEFSKRHASRNSFMNDGKRCRTHFRRSPRSGSRWALPPRERESWRVKTWSLGPGGETPAISPRGSRPHVRRVEVDRSPPCRSGPDRQDYFSYGAACDFKIERNLCSMSAAPRAWGDCRESVDVGIWALCAETVGRDFARTGRVRACPRLRRPSRLPDRSTLPRTCRPASRRGSDRPCGVQRAN